MDELLVEQLFRRSAGRITASLVRLTGPAHLDQAEEAVQEAVLRALQRWPFDGVPDNPSGWLYTVARNHVLAGLRHDGVVKAAMPKVAAPFTVEDPPDGDDELALVFLCCHPELPIPSQIALTLKTVGGLSVEEIARGLLARPATVAQRLVRAKRWLRTDDRVLAVPDEAARLDSVLSVLYLLFSAGYDALSGERVVRRELCAEAIRLGRLLISDARTDRPRVRALLALMLLHGSRLDARTDAAGDLVLIGEQDRARWDHAMIAEGTRVFDSACVGQEQSAFHVEAAIALCHVVPETDWRLVVRLYDQLLELRPSPVVAVNRLVAVAMAGGLEAGELRRLDDPLLTDHHLLPAALGALWLRLGDTDTAAECYREALSRPCSAPTKRFLRRHLDHCG